MNYQNRVEKLLKIMQANEVDVFIATRLATLSYVSGAFIVTSHVPSSLILSSDGDIRMLTSRYQVERIRHESWIKQCEHHEAQYWIPNATGTFTDVLVRYLRDRGYDTSSAKVGLEMSSIPDFGTFLAGNYLALTAELPDVSFVDLTSAVNEVLMIKESEEIEQVRRATEIADVGIEAGRRAISVGITETAIAGAVEHATRVAGNEWAWSQTAGTEVGSGYRTEFPLSSAAPPSRKIVQHGDVVQVDVSTMYNQYFGDVKATFVVGEPNARQKKLGEAYRAATERVLEKLIPGTPIQEIARAGAEVFEDAGYSGMYRPLFGHGIGTSARIPPTITENNETRLPSNIVVVVLVCVVEPGVGGLMLEAPVHVTDKGPVLLSKIPLELMTVPA